ncbi:MAG TPA: alanine racemase [Candidatus Aquicultor sp.]|jgi:alanine racemase
MNTRPLWAEIDLSAIKHNIREAKKVIGANVAIMAIVKANGYGHGAVPVAKAAIEAGASSLGVAIPEEGVALREAGITQPILVLSESATAAAPLIVEHGLTATVCSEKASHTLSDEATQQGKRVKVHVKVDTGMNRIGLVPERVAEFLRHVNSLPGLEVEGIFTHFAEADNPRSTYTNFQLAQFMPLVHALKNEGLCPPVRHAANSAGVYLHLQSHLDMVRIGISLYGLHPSEATKGKVDLRPSLSLKSRLSFVKNVKAGTGVSYGRIFRASQDTTIGTIPAGYGDGYTRLLSDKADVLVGGRRYPAVGNICMDQFMVDFGENTAVSVDDEAVLIGRQGDDEISADELASILGTINYEIVCMINSRVPREYRE